MNATQNYVALDLELNNDPSGSTPNPKIIQVGVSWGSWDHYHDNQLHIRKWYMDPQESIYPHITELTGISDQDIQKYAVSHQTVAKELSEIIVSNNVYINPITWGGGDSQALIQEFRERGIYFPHFGRRWIDVKTWYIYNRMSQGLSHTGGLSKCMTKFGIHFQGEAHRADVDAMNTLRLFFKMIDRQSALECLIKQAKEFK